MHSRFRFLIGAAFAVTGLLKASVGASADGAAHFDPRLGPPFASRQRPSLGSPKAPVVVIEVSNFKCPFCRRFHEDIFPELRKRYIASGKVQWVMLNASDNPADKDDPLFAMGRCLFDQGRYWDLIGFLFQKSSEPPGMLGDLLSKNPLIAPGNFNACLASPAVRREVALDFAECAPIKISGTPTFLLRKRRSDGQITGVRIEGNESAEYFERVIDRLLATP